METKLVTQDWLSAAEITFHKFAVLITIETSLSIQCNAKQQTKHIITGVAVQDVAVITSMYLCNCFVNGLCAPVNGCST